MSCDRDPGLIDAAVDGTSPLQNLFSAIQQTFWLGRVDIAVDPPP